MMSAAEFAALLHAKSLRRGRWIARCPAHGDKRPSLSIAEGRKHPIIFKCMSQGCTQDEVLKAMGLKWKDILGDRLRVKLSPRVIDEQTLEALRDLRRALISPLGAHLFSGIQFQGLINSIGWKIMAIEHRLYPELKAIRERDLKTVKFVEKWGWDKLWEVYEAHENAK